MDRKRRKNNKTKHLLVYIFKIDQTKTSINQPFWKTQWDKIIFLCRRQFAFGDGFIQMWVN